MTPRNPNPYCTAVAKSGKPCRAAATAGGLCFFHSNPNKASELGRKGGSNRHSVGTGDPLPKLDTVMAVRDAVAQLIEEVYAGKLQHRLAAGLAPLLNLQLRAIEATDLEQRVARLEKLLAKADNGSAKAPESTAGDFGDVPGAPNLSEGFEVNEDAQAMVNGKSKDQSTGVASSASKP